MIRTTPLRRITLHLLQTRLTDARTFMCEICEIPVITGT